MLLLFIYFKCMEADIKTITLNSLIVYNYEFKALNQNSSAQSFITKSKTWQCKRNNNNLIISTQHICYSCINFMKYMKKHFIHHHLIPILVIFNNFC